METIPTAEEFVKTALDGLNRISKEHAILLLIEFAKLHVIEALKEASEKADTCEVAVMRGFETVVNTDTILNAYPLENIK